MKRLPVLNDSFLDDIQIATPCTASWDEMVGDNRVRHCGQCRLNVYDVSEMTRAEAATLLQTNEGERTCLRLYRRQDGTLVTQDCWARLRAARRRGYLAFAAALVIVALTQLGLRWAGLTWLIKWSDGRAMTRTMGAIEPARTMGAPVPVSTPTPPSTPPVVMDEDVATMGVAPPIHTKPRDESPKKLMGARKR